MLSYFIEYSSGNMPVAALKSFLKYERNKRNNNLETT